MERFLYSSTKPFRVSGLKVDSKHRLQVREYGNPKGIPVIFLHGGPGFPTPKYTIRFFNKRHFHVIIFDQRGCGSSRPLGELTANNTQELIHDIEKIRLHCGLKKVVLVGGSWGATLAFLYMIQYPKNVISYIVTGFTLLKEALFTSRLRVQFPQDWEKFMNLGYPQNLKKTIDKYFQKIKEKNTLYIQEWTNLEEKHLTVEGPVDKLSTGRNRQQVGALIESYYFKHNFFLPKNYILNHLSSCSQIPGVIIHGREDVICNPIDSQIIHQKLPRSVLRLINHSGHSYFEPLICQALIQAIQELTPSWFDQRKNFYNG